jgi:hypothetical protein
MPIRKTHLSAARIEEYRSYLKQLYAEGIDVEIPAEWQESCPLEITRGSGTAAVFDLPVDNTAFIMPVCFVARSHVIVVDHDIRCSWDDQIELPYIRECGGRYKFGPQTYLTSEVLNGRLEKPFNLNRGSIVEGLILAYGCQPIPEEVRSRMVSVQLTLTDTLGREIRSEIGLVVESAAKREDTVLPSRTEVHVSAENTSHAAEAAITGEIAGSQNLG